jgi:hypothetical protein
VKETQTSLWQYFKVRLSHSSKNQFREELKDLNPLVALERIAAAGDVATVKTSSFPVLAMSARTEEASTSNLPRSTKAISFFGTIQGILLLMWQVRSQRG